MTVHREDQKANDLVCVIVRDHDEERRENALVLDCYALDVALKANELAVEIDVRDMAHQMVIVQV